MTTVRIVDCRARHCGQISRLMRVDHHRGLISLGVNIHRELRIARQNSQYAKAAYIDDHLAVIWGLMGSPMAPIGMVWMATSQWAMQHPRLIVREARRQLEIMSEHKAFLETTVIADDETAQRFACFLGFQPADGKHHRAYTRNGRKAMVRYLQTTPELMVSAGSGVQAGMIYLPEGR